MMKLFKTALVALVLLVNFLIAQPSWADPNLTKSPDYAEVTQSIDNLLKAKENPDRSESAPEEIERQLGELNLQKYILETATDWAQCRNETGKTLAVYARKPKKANQANALYFLGNGQTTDDDWNCDGVYLPSGTNVAGLTSPDAPQLAEPLAIKVVNGTQLVAKTNADTGAVELNITPAKVFKTGEGNWSIPTLSQTDIDAQVPNAPIED
ncbi:hypothetical protein [Microcoleus sp. FACHB-831]|uniref:hypothetical protein n=1 Tax=Microcoleus sp. FACHB-831 TaxID=2692827 RepID=UPI001F55319E|nr:hypothetical protein [Microcoleus sp. FACHB-831]